MQIILKTRYAVNVLIERLLANEVDFSVVYDNKKGDTKISVAAKDEALFHEIIGETGIVD